MVKIDPEARRQLALTRGFSLKVAPTQPTQKPISESTRLKRQDYLHEWHEYVDRSIIPISLLTVIVIWILSAFRNLHNPMRSSSKTS